MAKLRNVTSEVAGFCAGFAALNLLLAVASPANSLAGPPDARTIIQRSVAALRRDWKAAPHYNYVERDVDDHGTKTYQVTMISGSPYRRLIEINGAPLSAADQEKEQQKLDRTIQQRRSESKEESDHRVADYESDRRRDHRLMEELTRAFLFKLSGETSVASHRVYVLNATPRPGYKPPDRDTEVLPGMQGSLWIDKATFQWVKVEAEVIHPVSIEGFLATVEPGTRFELERMPVNDDIWLPAHFSVQSKAKILSFIRHDNHSEETYFNYRHAGDRASK